MTIREDVDQANRILRDAVFALKDLARRSEDSDVEYAANQVGLVYVDYNILINADK